jgi:hypothetical protein
MKRRFTALAWSLCGVALAMAIASLVLLALTRSEPAPDRFGFRGFQVIFVVVFSMVGALIASRRPGNPIGWLLLVCGIASGLQSLGDEYSILALRDPSAPSPGGAIGASLGEWLWVPIVGLIATFVPLLFPDGRLPSRRWRPVAWIAGAGIAIPSAAFFLQPGRLPQTPQFTNPFGIGDASAAESFEAVGAVGLSLLLGATLASAVGLVVRFQRATGDERQQLKWLAFAAVPLAIGFLFTALGQLVFRESAVTELGVIIAVPLIPIAIAVAVLKYHLYDIDLVINRTLVYGLLTAVLVAVYLGGVVGLGSLARSLSGQANNSVVIAASTLAVAALFRPVRRRIQGFIDRRFYRRKYDAARTLETFSARLRDDIDLSSLTGELLHVVRSTMQPAHVSLWLRPSEAPLDAGTGR